MELPGFLFGDEQSVVDRADAAGHEWADTFRRTRVLAPTDLRPIASGELIIIHDGTLDPFTPRWRLFGASFALGAAENELPVEDREAFGAAARATPWGALATCIRHHPPNTVAVITARARAVLDAWPELARMRFVGAAKRMPSMLQFPEPEPTAVGLDALVGQLFSGTLAVWGPTLGPARARLELALDAMAAVSLDEARDRLVARMVQLARENRRTKGTHAADPERIEAALAELPVAEQEALVPAVTADLLGLLYALLRRADAGAAG